jgi:hypothetical protein
MTGTNNGLLEQDLHIFPVQVGQLCTGNGSCPVGLNVMVCQQGQTVH